MEQTDTAINEQYRDVFKTLDGRWEGIFYVYEDERGQLDNPDLVQPKNISKEQMDQLPLRVINEIQVVHIYESESPFYQKGKIIDTYANENGELITLESDAVNKVENGEMFCIVEKPDDHVVHTGSLDDDNFIIWQRDIRDPLKIEYFKEKAEGNIYSIIGWGYYGEDDPNKSPKIWFYGAYEKQ